MKKFVCLILNSENYKCFLFVSSGYGLTCYCQGHCPNDHFNGTCEARPLSQCFAAVEEVYNPDTGLPEPEYTYGCLPPEEKGLMQVCSSFYLTNEFSLHLSSTFYYSVKATLFLI